MKKIVAITFAVLMGSAAAFAEGPVKEAAKTKCVADVAQYEVKDADGQCQCFVDGLSEPALEAYTKITDWESQATDEMKQVAGKCFPELQ
ncbi:MAG: hypothetical protein GC152_07190 [Alphaproteobacteria bacterium]|nr:hypothetical protein [Alphaproteobacteria bacterium]